MLDGHCGNKCLDRLHLCHTRAASETVQPGSNFVGADFCDKWGSVCLDSANIWMGPGQVFQSKASDDFRDNVDLCGILFCGTHTVRSVENVRELF